MRRQRGRLDQAQMHLFLKSYDFDVEAKNFRGERALLREFVSTLYAALPGRIRH